MSKQSVQKENFKNLVRGNSVSSIIAALNFANPSMKKELMDDYKATSVEDLARKLQTL